MNIEVHDAYANNLKHIDVKMPLGKIIGVSGVSGSGKSTLVKDIIAATGAQNYALSLPMSQRNLLADPKVIQVESVDHLPATVMIDVVNSVNATNSTLSTISGLHSMLRELFAVFGTYKCEKCGKNIPENAEPVLNGIKYSLFAEIKYDADFKEKQASICEQFHIKKIIYYDKQDEICNKKNNIAYARFFLDRRNNITISSMDRKLRSLAGTSLRALLSDNRVIDLHYQTMCTCGRILPKKSRALFSFNVSSQIGGGQCRICHGTGRVLKFNEKKMIVPSLPMNKGGIAIITDKGLKYTRVTEKFLDAVAKKYQFTWDRTFESLNPEQRKVILWGTDEKISFVDRNGSNGGKKNEPFLGVEPLIIAAYQKSSDPTKGNDLLASYVQTGICPECNGNRLDPVINQITYEGISLNDILSESIGDLNKDVAKWLGRTSYSQGEKELLNRIYDRTKLYVRVGCDYLELNRSSATLSGGELQRIRLCKFLSDHINDTCILLDEPTTGLHPEDIEKVMDVLQEMKANGHTVVLIEHNQDVLAGCDAILELGPAGGSEGGRVLYQGILDNDNKKQLLWKRDEYTHYNTSTVTSKNICMKDFSALYIKHQSVSFPMNSLVAICGVSGSGKSTFIRSCLIPYLEENKENLQITQIENLGQKNASRSTASNVGSLLNLNVPIAKAFEKQSGLSYRHFLLGSTSTDGKCPECGGKGYIEEEDHSHTTCTACNGRMFTDDVLQYHYHEKNIYEILKAPIEELENIFTDDKKIGPALKLCCRIGMGYLSLLRESVTLSKGELQRLRLINVLASGNNKNGLYILDEPSKGLHPSDLTKLLDIIFEITGRENTVIAVEHNLDFIIQTNYVIEFGPKSGREGGIVTFSGKPDELRKAQTATGRALRSISNNRIRPKESPNKKKNDTIKLGNVAIFKNTIAKTSFSDDFINRNVSWINQEYLSTVAPGNMLLWQMNDEKAIENKDSLPIMRPVGYGNVTYGLKANIIDAIRGYTAVSKYYQKCLNGNDIQDNITSEIFSPGSRLGKCPVCKGAGTLYQIDYSTVMKDGRLLPDVIKLLKARSNYSIAIKELNKDYGIDLTKPFTEMSDEEKKVFLFGDRTKTFYFHEKEKYWEGINRIILSELRYLDNELLKEKISNGNKIRECPVCHKHLLNSKYEKYVQKELSYGNMMYGKFDDIFNKIEKTRSPELYTCIQNMLALGLGQYSFFTKMNKLNPEIKTRIQLIGYALHPIQDSLLIVNTAELGYIDEKMVNFLNSLLSTSTVILNCGSENVDGDVYGRKN